MNNKHVQFLMYTGGVFLALLSVLAIISSIVLLRGNDDYNQNTISVNGIGEIDAVPNIATFSFSVTETAKTADQGQQIVSEKVSKIISGIKGSGVDEKDIKTQAYTIYPKYEWLRAKEVQEIVSVDDVVYIPNQEGKQVQTGFDVSQNISVTIRDFTKVPEILTQLADTGVNNLSGPNFEIEDPAGLEEEARAIAIKDAKARAKQLAHDLDVKLGKIVSFNEDTGGYPQPYMAKGAIMAMDSVESYAPELPTGQNTVTKNISIVYKIK